MHRGGEADGVSGIKFSKCGKHNTGWEPVMLDELGDDFKWHANTTLKNNELPGNEKVVYVSIPFYSCPGEFLSWRVEC